MISGIVGVGFGCMLTLCAIFFAKLSIACGQDAYGNLTAAVKGTSYTGTAMDKAA